MKNIIVPAISLLVSIGCQHQNENPDQQIITSDVDNFWAAYDKITSIQDSTLQYAYLDSLYVQKGTPGLKAIMEARNYTSQDYISAINSYPQFWESVRQNTLKTKQYVRELNQGIEKIKVIYPSLKPAKIYFTIGVLRTGGTYLDSLVLIGSEIAMADRNIITSEFPEGIRAGRRTFFDSDPINDLVLLNIHEYVHTQQNELVHNLLSYCLHEGVAEFVSTTAMGVPSATPAVAYGKKHKQVGEKFEREMFYGYNVNQWLWSDAPNPFGVRDLGYYIGYQLSELHYKKAKDKRAAIKDLIELDYNNEREIESFVDNTGFFSAPLEQLHSDFQKRRPTVVGVAPFQNKSENVSPNVKEITILFSEPLNGHNTGIDYGPLGKEYFPPMERHRIWAEDAQSWTVKIDLEPNRHYQFLISNNFRNDDGVPLKPYMVEFKTGND